MGRLTVGCLAVAIMLGTSSLSQAQEEAKAIIEKAIKAHGGAEKLDKNKGVQAKSQGKVEILGNSVPFTQETTTSYEGKFKELFSLEVMGQKVNIITIYNGEHLWLKANGEDKELPDKVLEEVKEAAYALKAARMTPLLTDKTFTLSLLGEMKVNDRPTVGVKISSKGHRDISVYFDRDTGLLAKTESRKLDGQTLQEVDEERIVTEYQDIDGLKTAKKMLITHSGKKFMDVEVTEVKFLDKVDDNEFQKP